MTPARCPHCGGRIADENTALAEAVAELRERARRAGIRLHGELIRCADAGPLLGRARRTALNWGWSGSSPLAVHRLAARNYFRLEDVARLLLEGAE